MLKRIESSILKGYLYTCVYSSIIHNVQNVEVAQAFIDRWISKMWCIYATEHYSASKRKGTVTHATTCMNLEGIMLSDIIRHMHKKIHYDSIYMRYFSSVQSLNRVRLFATPWTAACQASLLITNSQSLFRLMSIERVMPSNHLIFCCPFSSHLHSFPASGSFQVSQFLASGGQSIGVSASTSVLTMRYLEWSNS